MNRLGNKVAILSGAASGMGAAEARLFAREGARVIAADIQNDALRSLAEEINEEIGGEVVVPLRLDVRAVADWQAVVSEAESRWGGVDILVNNAGILKLADAVDTTVEEWDQVVSVNQTGTWLGIKTVVPAMRRRGAGSVVNISSVGGLVGMPGSAAYQATKGAVRMLSKHGAVAFGADNIRFNTIFPGSIHTPMLESMSPTPEALQANGELNPLKRLGTPEEIASVALFLASDDSSYMTGADLAVDGGYSAQ